MGSPVREFGRSFRWFHRSRAAYTGGLTRSVDFILLPGELSVHTGLSAVQATTSGPLAAAVGLVEVQRVGGPTVSANLQDPASWMPQAWGRLAGFTVGFHVARGDMSCWVFFQAWE
jgi:hypothetical protein